MLIYYTDSFFTLLTTPTFFSRLNTFFINILKKVFFLIPVRFPEGTTLGQCICLYARAGLVAHLWWVGTGAGKKKSIFYGIICLFIP
jgi:hypothetical protein